MTERVLGPTGGRRRKRLAILVPFLAIAALILAIGASAGPVSTASGFEGDDGNLAVNSTFDWSGFSPVTWTGSAPKQLGSKTVSGWQFAGSTDAVATTSDDGFAGGTKQDDNCATVKGTKAPNKDDLKRIYTAHKTVNGKVYLALAWVRIPQNTTSASAHVGFEFNQGTTACPSGSDGLVQRSAGDMLIVYDFAGSTTDNPILTVRRWITSGACEISSDTAPCWGPAANLTAGGFAEAKVNTTASVSDNVAPSTETLGLNEFGEAIINLSDAGIFTSGSCTSFGQAEGVSRSSGNSGQAAMEDLVGPIPVTISNCGTLIVKKVTDPSPDPTDTSFSFSETGSNNTGILPKTFSLKNGATNSTNVFPATDFSVTETVPSTFTLTSASCDNSSGTFSSANHQITGITVAIDETVTCTFTNTRNKVESLMDTAPWYYPNDKATVKAGTGQSNVTGSVTFKLYDTSGHCASNGTTGLLYTQTVNLSATTSTSKEVNTSNPGGGSPGATSVKIPGDSSANPVYWRVAYSGDTNHFGRLSDCLENINATLTGDTNGTNVP